MYRAGGGPLDKFAWSTEVSDDSLIWVPQRFFDIKNDKKMYLQFLYVTRCYRTQLLERCEERKAAISASNQY